LLAQAEEPNVALQSPEIVPDVRRQTGRHRWTQNAQGIGVAFECNGIVVGFFRDVCAIHPRACVAFPIAQGLALVLGLREKARRCERIIRRILEKAAQHGEPRKLASTEARSLRKGACAIEQLQ
jgi:hypothetical protein